MAWRKWRAVKRILRGARKRDRQAEQRRARGRRRRADPEALPLRERFWEAWDVWDYT